MIGQTILHYQILEKLGEGGMGVVYKAEDTRLDRTVAIKFLPRHIASNTEERKRFEIEAKASAALNHPTIATIHAIEEIDNEMFIVMEYIKGQELRALIKSLLERGARRAGGIMSLDDVLNYATQIASGLQTAHNKGIVHRDIKSSNIMVTDEGQVKIMDFGLAKVRGGALVTQVGTTLGTAAYMAPEQAQGSETDQRTDIWAFGVVLYEMLTGELPFKGDFEQAVIYAILNEEPHAAEGLGAALPDGLAGVVLKCLQKDRRARFENTGELVHALLAVKKDGPEARAGVNGKNGRHRVSAIWKLMAGLALLALLVISSLRWFSFPPVSNRSNSIAVLPFKNLNGDAAQEYFCDGMTETIISSLANISSLKVISRTSVTPFKKSEKNTREIAQELDVAHIVEGSVLVAGEKVRIFAKLIDAETDANLWAQTYDRNMTDIFEIHSDVAHQITDVLEIALGADAQARVDQSLTSDFEAYRLFLQGQFYFNRGDLADIDTSLALFQQAIERDPDFAMAYAALARAYIVNTVDHDPNPEWEKRAYVALQQALALDAELAEAYVARGMWYWMPNNHFAHKTAIQDFEKAIELKPGLSAAYELLSLVQLHVGLLDKARATSSKGIELDPGNIWAQHFLGQVFFFQGNYDEALKIFENIGEQFIPFFRISLTALTLAHLGRVQEATRMLEQGLVDYPNDPQLNSSYAIILASLGRRHEAQQRIKLAIENEMALRHVHHLYHNLAAAYSLMGEKREALKWLVKASDNGLTCYPLFERDTNLNNLRGDEQFETFMSGLKSKWRYYQTL